MTEPVFKSELVRVLSQRGFINQATDLAALDERASQGPITAYIGFDLTAPSLHVGSLIQINVLRWLKHLGHRPIVLLGRSTTQVGDPSGKTTARPMLAREQIMQNEDGIVDVLSRVLEDPDCFRVNGWFEEFLLLDFLREFGPHFPVGRMMALDSVKSRVEGDGMSFLEFTYSILQSVDFLKLVEDDDCVLQIGGSDQWGNIVSGVDLVRRKTGKQVFGLTTPLMLNSQGEKMGKTANGAVWLSPDLTTPFDFWQFWRNVEDAKVPEFLRLFTDLDMDMVEGLSGLQGEHVNEAKRIMATEVTSIVHGRSEANKAAFEADRIFRDGDAPTTHVLPVTRTRLFTGRERATIADLLVEAGLVKSKGEADRLAQNNGVRINDKVEPNARRHLIFDDLLSDDTSIKLAVGKKKIVTIQVEE